MLALNSCHSCPCRTLGLMSLGRAHGNLGESREGTSLKVGEKRGREGSSNGVIARAGEEVGREERGLSSHYRGVDRGGVARGRRRTPRSTTRVATARGVDPK